MTSSSLSAPLSSLPQTSIDDLRKLHEENAILKTTLGTLKEQLQIDLEEERYQQQVSFRSCEDELLVHFRRLRNSNSLSAGRQSEQGALRPVLRLVGP